MTAQVYILLSSVKNALVVPVTALSTMDGKDVVQVVGPSGKISAREVKTGVSDNVYVQLVSGVKAGEEVIVSQQSNSGTTTTQQRPGPPMGF